MVDGHQAEDRRRSRRCPPPPRVATISCVFTEISGPRAAAERTSPRTSSSMPGLERPQQVALVEPRQRRRAAVRFGHAGLDDAQARREVSRSETSTVTSTVASSPGAEQRQELHLREVVEPERQRLEQVADGLDVEARSAGVLLVGPGTRTATADVAGIGGRPRARQIRVEDGGERVARGDRVSLDPAAGRPQRALRRPLAIAASIARSGEAPGSTQWPPADRVDESDGRSASNRALGLAGEADADHGVGAPRARSSSTSVPVEVGSSPSTTGMKPTSPAALGARAARPAVRARTGDHAPCESRPARSGRPGIRAARQSVVPGAEPPNVGQKVSGSGNRRGTRHTSGRRGRQRQRRPAA